MHEDGFNLLVLFAQLLCSRRLWLAASLSGPYFTLLIGTLAFSVLMSPPMLLVT